MATRSHTQNYTSLTDATVLPVDMDGAAALLGVSRRFLVDKPLRHRELGHDLFNTAPATGGAQKFPR